MKKALNLSSMVSCMLLSFGLISCSSGDNSIPDAHDYSVTCDQSDYYTFGGTVKSTAGNEAKVTITSNFAAYEIVGCKYNGNDCTFVSENEDSKSFSYTMPDSDVKLEVIGKWNDLTVSGTDNFLSFDENNTYTAEISSTDFILAFNTTCSFMTIADITCFSTNEDILPNSAISVTKQTANNSNSIVGGKVHIDCLQAKDGESKIVLRVKNGNALKYDDIIVKTVTFSL